MGVIIGMCVAGVLLAGGGVLAYRMMKDEPAASTADSKVADSSKRGVKETERPVILPDTIAPRAVNPDQPTPVRPPVVNPDPRNTTPPPVVNPNPPNPVVNPELPIAKTVDWTAVPDALPPFSLPGRFTPGEIADSKFEQVRFPSSPGMYFLLIESTAPSPRLRLGNINKPNPLSATFTLAKNPGFHHLCTVNHEGTRLAMPGYEPDQPVTVYSTATGEPIARMAEPMPSPFAVTYVDFAGTNLLLIGRSGSEHDTMEVWDIKAAKRKASFPFSNFRGTAETIAVSANGRYCAIVKNGRDDRVTLYNLLTGQIAGEGSFPGGRDGGLTEGITFSPDGKLLSVLFNSGRLLTWNMADGRLVSEYKVKQSSSDPQAVGNQYKPALDWLPDSSGWVIAGSYYLKANTGQQYFAAPQEKFKNQVAGRLVGGKWAVRAKKLGQSQWIELDLLNVPGLFAPSLPPPIAANQPVLPFGAPPLAAWTVMPDGVEASPLADAAPANIPLTGNFDTLVFPTSLSRKVLAVTFKAGNVRPPPKRFELCDLRDGKTISNFSLPGDKVVRKGPHALSPDGASFATVTPTGTVDVYDTATGMRTTEIRFPGKTESKLFLVDFVGPDELVTGRTNAATDALPDRFEIWNLKTGKSTRAFVSKIQHDPGNSPLAFSANRRYLAAIGMLWNRVVVFDLVSATVAGECNFNVRVEGTIRTNNSAPAEGIAFSPDGKSLAILMYSGRTVVFDVASGKITSDQKLTRPVSELRNPQAAFTGPPLAWTSDSTGWVVLGAHITDVKTGVTYHSVPPIGPPGGATARILGGTHHVQAHNAVDSRALIVTPLPTATLEAARKGLVRPADVPPTGKAAP